METKENIMDVMSEEIKVDNKFFSELVPIEISVGKKRIGVDVDIIPFDCGLSSILY